MRQTIKPYSVTLILPCKNEEKALITVLASCPKVDEIIVVDNKSTDKTAKIAKKLGAKVLYEVQEENGIGYGFALARGIKEASGDIIVCMDGDGSYPVEEIPILVKQLVLKKIDFISCNRLPFKNQKDRSTIRMMGVRILNLFIYLLFGFKIKDSLTGMWIFHKETINNLVLVEGGWNFSLEIKLNAITNPAIKFAEFGIFYRDRVLDSSKQNLFRTGIIHLLYLFKKRFQSQKANLSFAPNWNLKKVVQVLTKDKKYD